MMCRTVLLLGVWVCVVRGSVVEEELAEKYLKDYGYLIPRHKVPGNNRYYRPYTKLY